MIPKLIWFFLCCGTASLAKEVVVVVTEFTNEKISDGAATKSFRQRAADTAFALDIGEARALKFDGARGPRIDSTSKYTIAKKQLKIGERSLHAADEILAQCRIDGTDIVITRHSYTSVNPKYWFFALSGHPAQFSEISVVLIDDRGQKAVDLTDLIGRQSNASQWRGGVFAKNEGASGSDNTDERKKAGGLDVEKSVVRAVTAEPAKGRIRFPGGTMGALGTGVGVQTRLSF